MYKLQTFTAYKEVVSQAQMAHYGEAYRNESPQAILDRILSDKNISDEDMGNIKRLSKAFDTDGDGAIDSNQINEFMNIQERITQIFLNNKYTLENGESSYPTFKAIMTDILRLKMPNLFPKGLFLGGKIKFMLTSDRGLEVYKNDIQVGYIDTVQGIFEPNRIK